VVTECHANQMQVVLSVKQLSTSLTHEVAVEQVIRPLIYLSKLNDIKCMNKAHKLDDTTTPKH